MLTTLLGSKEGSSASVVYNYKHGFSGFAAMLTPEQAKQLAEFPEVISVEPSKMHTATTTRSWDFLGLNYHMHGHGNGLLNGSNYGEDVIIGVVDTGIWPESKSFSEKDTGQYRQDGRQSANSGQIGATITAAARSSAHLIFFRFVRRGPQDGLTLSAGPQWPRHTLCVQCSGVGRGGVSFHGLAKGVPRGGAPRARLAVYKSAWADGSAHTAGVLAAIDDAIHDGVDVLSLSLGLLDENSFGALHAVQKEITVVYAGGNDGPRPQTVGNTSPWVITVAASKIDRLFPTAITLGNKQLILGQSLYYQENNTSSKNSSLTSLTFSPECTMTSLNATGVDVKGKILLCSPYANDPNAYVPKIIFQQALKYVVDGGGLGLIFAQYTTDVSEFTTICQGIACVLVDLEAGNKIRNYIQGASSPMAKIGPAHTIMGKDILGPKVASFSSRGPSPDYPDIMKPDIAAPGANILAAVGDGYQSMSGTSMATPHVAGIVALLKALHQDWSPAAIKSAIMSSAHVTDKRGMVILAEGLTRKIANPFDYGGGNINPNGAADPGLVYDIDPRDYTKFFGCTIVRRTNVTCNASSLPAYHLNLPSIAIPSLRRPITMSRTVTNVGDISSVYHAEVQSPAEPPMLVFDAANRVCTLKVKFSTLWKLQGDYTFGSITWRSDRKAVRIPVAARITVRDFYADVA